MESVNERVVSERVSEWCVSQAEWQLCSSPFTAITSTATTNHLFVCRSIADRSHDSSGTAQRDHLTLLCIRN